jgi:hypothetical protein
VPKQLACRERDTDLASADMSTVTPFAHIIAHGVAVGMSIREAGTESFRRVQSVTLDPRARDRLVISYERGGADVAELSQWFQRLIEV